MAEKALLIDTSKCTGCRGCQVSCKQWHNLPAEKTLNRGTYQNPPDLTPNTWTLVTFNEYQNGGKVEWLFRKSQCMHCTDAACVKVCPTGAVRHHELGFVDYDEKMCSGCGYCVQFCPFDVPRLSGDKISGIEVMQKCVFCADRVGAGMETACAKTCPPGAISFGDRDQLVTTGRARVSTLKATNPSASLYGENIVGGTHIMYVLEHQPEAYGLPANPQVPLAAILWQDLVQPFGQLAVGAAIAGLAVNFAIAGVKARQRRMEAIAAQERRAQVVPDDRERKE